MLHEFRDELMTSETTRNGAKVARRTRRLGPPIALVASLLAHAAFAALVGTGFIASGKGTAPVTAIEVDMFDGVAVPPEAPAPSGPMTGQPVAPRRATARAPSRSSATARPIPLRSVETPNPVLTSPTAVSEDVAAAPVRFAMSAGTVAGRGAPAPRDSAVAKEGGPVGSAAGGDVRDGDGTGDVVGEDRVSVPARLLGSANVPYPASAREAEIEADVQVELVVGLDGRVSRARVVSRCGYGLDEAALQGVRNFRFSPALRDGRPVRVRMRWPVQFRLR